MSTTVVETFPPWVLKLLSQESKSEHTNNQNNLTGKKLTDSNHMAHKCAAFAALNAKSPPPKPTTSSGSRCQTHKQQSIGQNYPLVLSSQPIDNIITPGALGGTTNVSNFLSSTHNLDYFCEILNRIREPIVAYEERKGIPRDMQYTFVGLMTTLAQQTYNAILTILTMLVNLVPLAEGFLQMMRFIIDKCIDVCHTANKKDKAFKLVIFAGELVVMFFAAVLITGIIFVPVLNLMFYAFYKLWGIVLPH